MRIGPVLGRLGLVLLGGYVGIMGAVVHRHRVEALGVVWPWGLLLALVVTAAVAVAAGRLQRLGESWYALGWAASLFVQLSSPGGSYLVAADGLGWTYTILGLGLLGFLAVRNSRLAR